ncbi:AAA family ATPase [Peribacillus frigoritolerans]|uniref:AAA family ATPase n=1 Tax=Peribacillus frigoritolerans TaxID=450367 RepID=UPI003B8CE190
MEFFLTSFGVRRKSNGIHLVPDNWDDFGFKNMYAMYYIDESGNETKIGSIKFGEYGLEAGSTSLERKFIKLNDNQFSLGQTVGYYKKIKSLGDVKRREILTALKDIAYSPELYEKAFSEEVTKVSLFRDIHASTVKGQFRRIANGGVILTDYEFEYKIPESLSRNSIFRFEVIPEVLPPTNIHAIIGTNGSGKTTTLKGILNEYLSENDAMDFTNAIFVSFSVFGETNLEMDRVGDKKYSYIGVRNSDSTNKSYEDLLKEYQVSINNLLRRKRIDKLFEVMNILNSDINLASYNIQSIIADYTDLVEKKAKSDKISIEMTEIFKSLSSGHQIVMLTIIKLIDLIVEKTLIIIDEPETHLHPLLLSAFIRTISELIIKENAVAILATHSPVVLQEIPKSCVSILRRHGDYAQVVKPKFETFGENVGVLTEEVFGLEITNTGFHSLLKNAVIEKPNYESVIEMFNNQLSLEAKSIVRAYINNNVDGDE